ncbi:hypothetical protein [Cohnella abietis]|uniref:Lipoprotein n=1 Tax=Cohnella abietis TaxID=2507935 RepID=A0A3T1DDW5_9BACL|nr:hypothetical protein [Cohnella abietis]BBI36085.1 hypothetical protein KCTCHS21_54840 [Cohnella abietis]
MRSLRTLILIMIIALLTVGCSTSTKKADLDNFLLLEVSKPDTDGKTYIEYKTIKDAATVTEIKQIFIQADESNAMASMSRNADRKIILKNTNPVASSEPQTYGIWYSPDSKYVEVVSETFGGGYIKLNLKESKIVLEVL